MRCHLSREVCPHAFGSFCSVPGLIEEVTGALVSAQVELLYYVVVELLCWCGRWGVMSSAARIVLFTLAQHQIRKLSFSE